MNDLIRTTEDKTLTYKALSGAGSVQLAKSPIGTEFTVSDIIQTEVPNKDGEACVLTAIIATDGNVYQTLSPTLAADIVMLYDIFGEEIKGKTLRFITGTSNSGNKFFKLDIVS